MTARRAVDLAYLGYAVLLAVGLVNLVGTVSDRIVAAQVEAGRLDPGWLDAAYAMGQGLGWGVLASLVSGLAAFGLACLPLRESAPAAAAQRAYLRRFAAIALSFWMLVYLTPLFVGWFDEAAAAGVFAWAAWRLALGWRAQLAGAALRGPAGWRLFLLGNVLAVAAVVAFFIVLALEGGRLISG